MLERVPTVPTSQELLDQAFGRASKLEVNDPVKYHRVRKTLEARLKSVADTTVTKLDRIHNAFPNLDHVRDYELEMLRILVGEHELKRALGSVGWAARTIRQLCGDELRAFQRIRDIDGFHKAQKRVYGRIADIINDLDGPLAILADAREKARHLPTVDPQYATIVIAGFPNVGKSSLLARWTRASPEIASYAFTTKQSNVGHLEATNQWGEPVMVQLVDTPGLLDRPDAKRNPVERQAVAALRHAADAVLFIVDPSETSGFTVGQQDALLEQTRSEMVGIPFLVAESKSDLHQSGTQGRVAFSSETGEGLDELATAILQALPSDEDLEEDPLEAWQAAPDDGDDW